jgi:glycerol-3-phosphate dehydrogenase
VKLVSPIGSAVGGSGNLSTSLSNVARLAAHPKFVWVFNANYDGTIIYNNPVFLTNHELKDY